MIKNIPAKILLFILPLLPCAAYAQKSVVDELKNDFDAKYKYSKIEPELGKDYVRGYIEQTFTREYFDLNARPLSDTQFTLDMLADFKKYDILLFGEEHNYDVPLVQTLRTIYAYNRVASAGAKIKNIYFEQPLSRQYLVDEMPLDGADKCVERYPGTDETALLLSYICELRHTGAKVWFIDLNRVSGEGGFECCQYYKTTIKGSGVSVLSNEGMDIRNCAMAGSICEMGEGKAAFFGGASHVLYGGMEGSVTLSEMLKTAFPEKKILSAFIFGGKGPESLDTSGESLCAECKKMYDLGELTYLLFDKIFLYAPDAFTVIDMERDSYKIFDKIYIFPRELDFYD
jgi:hypothetical protein